MLIMWGKVVSVEPPKSEDGAYFLSVLVKYDRGAELANVLADNWAGEMDKPIEIAVRPFVTKSGKLMYRAIDGAAN